MNFFDNSYEAGEDLTEHQNRAVTLDGDKLKVPATEDTPLIGVLLNAPAKGEAGRVVMMGLNKAVAGATVTQHERLKSIATADGTPEDTGKLIPVSGNNKLSYATALESGEKDELISIMVSGVATEV